MTSRLKKKKLPVALAIPRVFHSLCKFILETKQGSAAIWNTVIYLDKGSCKALANVCIKLRLESTFQLLIAKITKSTYQK